jgi:hypothetical protein
MPAERDSCLFKDMVIIMVFLIQTFLLLTVCLKRKKDLYVFVVVSYFSNPRATILITFTLFEERKLEQ